MHEQSEVRRSRSGAPWSAASRRARARSRSGARSAWDGCARSTARSRRGCARTARTPPSCRLLSTTPREPGSVLELAPGAVSVVTCVADEAAIDSTLATERAWICRVAPDEIMLVGLPGEADALL